jgi:hypothetical protein
MRDTVIHGKSTAKYRKWSDFFATNPNPTARTIFNFGCKLAREYNLTIHF